MIYDFSQFKTIMAFASSPAAQAAQNLINSPAAQAVQNLINSPAILGIQDITNKIYISSYLSNYSKSIVYLNNATKLISSLPNQDFQNIKHITIQTNSILRNIAKTNSETISSTLGQTSENDANESIVFSKSFAELVTDIDDSINLPEPDVNKQLYIQKSNHNYIAIISLVLAILDLICNICQNNSSTTLIKQNQTELIQENHKQTEELKKQNQSFKHIEQLLEQSLEQTKENDVLIKKEKSKK